MHRLIATCLAAAAAGTPLPARETGAVRGTATLEENGDFVRGAVILVVGSGAFALTGEREGLAIDNVPAGSCEVLAPPNVQYRNHTSFIKEPAPEMGRGVRMSCAVRFH